MLCIAFGWSSPAAGSVMGRSAGGSSLLERSAAADERVAPCTAGSPYFPPRTLSACKIDPECRMSLLLQVEKAPLRTPLTQPPPRSQLSERCVPCCPIHRGQPTSHLWWTSPARVPPWGANEPPLGHIADCNAHGHTRCRADTGLEESPQAPPPPRSARVAETKPGGGGQDFTPQLTVVWTPSGRPRVGPRPAAQTRMTAALLGSRARPRPSSRGGTAVLRQHTHTPGPGALSRRRRRGGAGTAVGRAACPSSSAPKRPAHVQRKRNAAIREGGRPGPARRQPDVAGAGCSR